MFGSKIEKATLNWPHDKIDQKNGTVVVYGEYVTPEHVGYVLFLWFLFICGLIILGAVMPALGLALPAFFGIWMLLKKKLNVRIGPDVIRINGRKYAQNAQTEFRCEPHRKQPEGRIYAGAVEVVMQYGERRIPIAAMREKDVDRAVALVVRLQNWCNRFEDLMAMQETAETSGASSHGEFGPAPDIR